MDEPVDQRLAPHLQVDDLLDPLAEIGQHPVQRLGLRYGARKPVQDEAARGIRLAQALAHDLDHDLVRHQLTPVHVAPDPVG